jgi:hypothetical protein
VVKRLILEGDDVDWVVLSCAITAFRAHGLFHGYHERQVVVVELTGLLCVCAVYLGKKFESSVVSMLDVKEK